MRVCDLSITCVLKAGKLRQPEVPASTTVVTPDLKVKSSGDKFSDVDFDDI